MHNKKIHLPTKSRGWWVIRRVSSQLIVYALVLISFTANMQWQIKTWGGGGESGNYKMVFLVCPHAEMKCSNTEERGNRKGRLDKGGVSSISVSLSDSGLYSIWRRQRSSFIEQADLISMHLISNTLSLSPPPPCLALCLCAWLSLSITSSHALSLHCFFFF